MELSNKQKGRPSCGGKSMIKLPNSPAIMASGISNEIFCHWILMNFVLD